jgi:aldose sugar dehydrogenase
MTGRRRGAMRRPRWLGPLLILWLVMALDVAATADGGPPVSGDVPAAHGWRVETVAGGLEHPWSIAWLPDGSTLITERPGRLRQLRDGRLDPEPIAGVPPVLAFGQGGLLDVAPHPRFAANGLIYFTLAEGTPDANRTALARGRLSGHRLEGTEVIFRNPDLKGGGEHFGSRLLWLPDGSLLMSIGDGGNPPRTFRDGLMREQAQNLGTDFGKVLRLTEDGRPWPGNPLAARPGARPEVWTLGHRNIQGLALDPRTGRVWANEHGARGGDELNVIVGGRNYGWPTVTDSREYWGPRVSAETARPGMEAPRLVWTPSKAPSGLVLYTGDRYPGWTGDLFSGALKFAEIRRIRLEGERVVGEDKLGIGARVRDVRQGPDGYLYVLTDEVEGRLLRIVPEGGAP